MKAPKYIDNSLFTFLERAKAKKKHLDSLFEIKHTKKYQNDISTHLNNINKYKSNKNFAYYNDYQKTIETNERKNQKILGRILSISTQKRSHLSLRGKINTLGSFSKERHDVKSLNYSFRKHEAEQITLENNLLAVRLMGKTPFQNHNQLTRDFSEHEKYKNRIRKMTPLGELKIRGLDQETSRCYSSVSCKNSKQRRLSDQSQVKKIEGSLIEKARNFNKKRLKPIDSLNLKKNQSKLKDSKPKKMNNSGGEQINKKLEVNGVNKRLVTK